MKWLKICFRVSVCLFLLFVLIDIYYSTLRFQKLIRPEVALTDSIEFSQDGELLTATTGLYSYLWNVDNSTLLKVIPNTHFYTTSASHISPNGRYMSNYGPLFTLYDIFEDRTIFEVFDYGIKSYESTGMFSYDSRYVMLDYFSYIDIENRTIIRDQVLYNKFNDLCITLPLNKPINSKSMVVFFFSDSKNIDKNDPKYLSFVLYDPISGDLSIEYSLSWNNENYTLFHYWYRTATCHHYQERPLPFKNRVFVGGSRIFVFNDDGVNIMDLDNLEKIYYPLIVPDKNQRERIIPWVSHNGEYFAWIYGYDHSVIKIHETSSGKILSELYAPKNSSIFNFALHIETQAAALGLNFPREQEIHLYNLKTNKKDSILLKAPINKPR